MNIFEFGAKNGARVYPAYDTKTGPNPKHDHIIKAVPNPKKRRKRKPIKREGIKKLMHGDEIALKWANIGARG